MKRFALATITLGVMSACSMDLAPMGIPLGTVTLNTPTQDTGGSILERAAEVHALIYAAERGAAVEKRIGGDCLSACTFYLSPDLAEAGAVCFERDAVLGFHGPRYEDQTMTEDRRMVAASVMAQFYPRPIADWFLAGPARGDELALVAASDLIDAGLARGCV